MLLAAGLLNDRRQNRDNLRHLADQRLDRLGFDEAKKHSKPVSRLSRLFERDGAFGDEIGPALRRISLLEHGADGGAGTHALATEVTQIGRRSINAAVQFDNGATKLKGPLSNICSGAALVVHFFNFQFSIFN